MTATFEQARERALALIDDDKPVDAVCAITHALHYAGGLDYREIGERLSELSGGVDGLRSWA